MRFLVAFCLSILLFSMAVLPTQATPLACPYELPPPPSGPAALAPATPQLLFINEILPRPRQRGKWPCQTHGNFPWLELYNPQNQAYDLYNARAIIDRGPGTQPVYMRLPSVIPARGYLVVFLTNYSFSADAPTPVRLLINTTVIDEVLVPGLADDQDYARIPDGSSSWEISSSTTIGASNTPPVATITPVATKKPTATPKHHKSGSKQKTGKGSETAGSGEDYSAAAPHTTNPTLVNGIQPAWNTLHLPTSTHVNSVDSEDSTPQENQPAPTPASSQEQQNLPLTIFLIIGLCALSGLLFWLWRLFKSP